jgi:hypothetical protein
MPDERILVSKTELAHKTVNMQLDIFGTLIAITEVIIIRTLLFSQRSVQKFVSFRSPHLFCLLTVGVEGFLFT